MGKEENSQLERVANAALTRLQLEKGGGGTFGEEIKIKGIWHVTVPKFQRAQGLEESRKGRRLGQMRQRPLPVSMGLGHDGTSLWSLRVKSMNQLKC